MKHALAIPALLALLAAGCATPQQKVVLRGELIPLPVDDVSEAEVADAEETIRRNFERVYFPFDSAELTPETRDLLSENAELLMKYPQIEVRIEGHTDEAGSDLYNLALGDRRAFAVWDYLVTLGVSGQQLERVSMGEYNPVVSAGERPEARNRRAEFIVTRGGDEVGGSRGS